jgi:hypothetical protein
MYVCGLSILLGIFKVKNFCVSVCLCVCLCVCSLRGMHVFAVCVFAWRYTHTELAKRVRLEVCTCEKDLDEWKPCALSSPPQKKRERERGERKKGKKSARRKKKRA